ncbi:MAG: hypothetical protein COB59_00835 [Rhodospirillaceae bacterium]|nr:MAG: hypothetical protein COB59_00835 [Rhodospirillaceae bacterium]
MFKSKFRPLWLLFALVALGGCASSPMDQAMARGEFAKSVEFFDTDFQSDFAKISHRQHYSVCFSLLNVKRFGRFFDCYDKLDAKVQANDGKLTMVGNLTPERTEVQLKEMRTQAYLEVGEFAKAREDALRIIKLSKESNLSNFDNEAFRAIEYIASWGIVASMEEENAILSRITPYGVLTIVAARSDNEKKAREWMAELEALSTGGFMSGLAGYGPKKQTWLAKGAFVLEDYQTAYDVMTREEEVGFGGAMAKGLMGFAMAFPTTPFVMMGMTGRIDYDDLSFFYRFEPKFILHRSQLEIGRIQEAKKGYDEILAEPRVQGFGSVLFMALHGRGRVAEKEGQPGVAIDYYKRAIEVLEAQRASIGNEKGRIGFVGNKQDIYQDIIHLLIRDNRPGEAFEYAERGKARALVDLLATKKQFASNEQGAEVNQLITQIESSSFASIRMAQNETSAARMRSLGDQARAKIKTLAPEISSLVSVDIPPVADLQARLGANDTLIEYFGSGKDLIVFTVTRWDVTARPLNGKGLDTLIRSYRDTMYEYGTNAHAASSKSLYELLIAPLARDIKTKNLTIVPHGALHYVPFAALLDERGEAMIERYSIRVLPSASVLFFLKDKRRTQTGGDMLLLGNPDLGDPQYDLPGAEQEAQAIFNQRNQSNRSTLLKRQDAKETTTKGLMGNYRYLHFATHGVFTPEDPLNSALLLRKDDRNDGRLTAAELYDINLNAELVTLSACETGLGTITQGDDVVGLTRGFMFAGASTIVASLWKVSDDATSVLMQKFYQNLETMEKREALRKAQLHVKTNINAHPFFWAAFQMSGGE